MGLVTIWWERHHQGTQGELFAIPFADRFLIASRAVWFYLAKLVWPAELAFSYPRWSISIADPLDYIWVVATVAAALVIYLARRKLGRGPEVAALFFVTTLAPMLGFVMLSTFRYSFVADHYQYLASIGPIALAAAGAAVALQRVPRFRAVLVAVGCALILLPLGYKTWRQAGIYKNEETLWRATIATNPSSWMAHNNLAIQHVQQGRPSEAIPLYEKAIELNPDYAEAHFNLANAFVRLDQKEDAVPRYERALALFPGYTAAHVNLASVLSQLGRAEEAEAHLRQAVEKAPNDPEPQLQLAITYVNTGRLEEGLEILRRIVGSTGQPNPRASEAMVMALLKAGRIDEAVDFLRSAAERAPGDIITLTALGNLLTELGRTDEALVHLQRAVEANPRQPEPHYNLGNALLEARRLDEALAEFRQALALKPDYFRARNNLANLLMETGRPEEAVAEYQKALELEPDYSVAHRNLARALRELGRYDEAIEHLNRAWEIDRKPPPNR
jgi:tetratricopeptide (TPR) repeat protein